MNTNHCLPEDRQKDRVPKFDINKIDYQWIEKENNVKDLKLAYEELEYDGYFPDLLKCLGKKIASLDNEFRLRFEPEKKLSAEEEKAVNADLFSFLDEMQKTDDKLRGKDKGDDDQENQSIFSNSN